MESALDQQCQARPSPYRWVVFGALAAAYVLVFFHRLCPSVVALDIMADLGAGPALRGLLASAYFYPYAAMQMPAGLLADSWGPRRSVTLFFALAGVASILFGLAWSTTVAVAARVLVGLGVAMVFVPTMKIITCWFPRGQFALMAGLLLALGGLGAYVASAPLALLSAAFGWRASFVVIGLISMVVGVAIWFLVRDNPADKGLPPAEARPCATEAPAIGLWQGALMVLGHGRFYPLAGWFISTGVVFFGLGGLWAGPYLAQAHGLGPADVGHVLSMMAVGMVLGSPLLSWLSDKVLRSRKAVLIGCAVGLCGLTAPLALAPADIPLWGLYLGSALLSVFCAAASGVGFIAAKELFPVEIAGTAVGLINFFPFLGGALGQPLLGWLLQRHGGRGPYAAAVYGQAFEWCLWIALAGLFCALFCTETWGRPAPTEGDH